MIFGDHLTPAGSAAPAEWIRTSCHGEPGTVGALVPNQFAATIRLCAPDPGEGDWWAEYRDLFSIVASIGERYTSTPNRAWFAVWEGHGFPIAAPLDLIPRFELPDRAYYLMEGPVTAIDRLRYPGDDGWRNPDLFWPDDHQWFVATDVDFWSLYVGGDNDFVAELASSVPVCSELMGLDSRLEIEN